jgi:transcriptional regulator with XRE-family HTH domain
MGYALARKDVRSHTQSVAWWENLRKIREAKGLSGVAFADLMDETPQRISDWENGRNPHPRLDTLERLAAALKIKVGDLVAEQVDLARHAKEIEQKPESTDNSPSPSGPEARPSEVPSAGSVVAAPPRLLKHEPIHDLIELAAAASEIKSYFESLIIATGDQRASGEDAVARTGTSAHGARVHRSDRKTPSKGRRKG